MELGPNVTVLEEGDRTIYIVGTAHISPKSVREVRETIEAVRPDTVCVELCKSRYETLTDPDRLRKLDLFQVIKQKKVLFVLSNLALSAYQRRLGEKLGIKPGAELLEAVNAAKDVGAELVLADRDVQATLKRTWRSLSFWSKNKVLGALLDATFSKEEVTEEELEKLKERDTINEAMAEFAKALPQVKTPLIDERDQYLISSIEDAPGKCIVAVVGAAHVAGMLAHRGETVDREALSVIPPKSRWTSVLQWVIPTLMIGCFAFGWGDHEGKSFYDLLYAWIVPNAVAAALLTAVAGGHILSVLSAAVASPITSLNPAIGAGMVVGLIEAWLRKPQVGDYERLADDSASLRGIYRNRLTRVLLVAALSTVGSALGAWVGAAWVLASV